MHPKNISITDYTYELPPERIAKYPLEQRDASKLLIWKQGDITESSYTAIAEQIPENSFLVFNNTKVVEARMLFQKESGGSIEIFCLEPGPQYSDITTAMLQKHSATWQCLVGGAKKWKDAPLERIIDDASGCFTLKAVKRQQLSETYLIELSWDRDISFAEVLHLAGAVPLPPYLNRAAELTDKERYQTVYAMHDGSVAAPTAGLHFTPAIFKKLEQKNINHGFVTLHVGAGTFKPVKSGTMAEHEMHAEWIDVSRDLITQLSSRKEEKIVAVGTTSLRTLESLYWLGVKARKDPWILPEELALSQWEAYDLDEQDLPMEKALLSLVHWLDHNRLTRLVTKTQIIIAPGYQFRIIDGLITNFHQPQSTLLLLVAAITGSDWKKIYSYALSHDFRFLSYGDGSLLWLK